MAFTGLPSVEGYTCINLCVLLARTFHEYCVFDICDTNGNPLQFPWKVIVTLEESYSLPSMWLTPSRRWRIEGGSPGSNHDHWTWLNISGAMALLQIFCCQGKQSMVGDGIRVICEGCNAISVWFTVGYIPAKVEPILAVLPGLISLPLETCTAIRKRIC